LPHPAEAKGIQPCLEPGKMRAGSGKHEVYGPQDLCQWSAANSEARGRHPAVRAAGRQEDVAVLPRLGQLLKTVFTRCSRLVEASHRCLAGQCQQVGLVYQHGGRFFNQPSRRCAVPRVWLTQTQRLHSLWLWTPQRLSQRPSCSR
jgi:hypothetical protein